MKFISERKFNNAEGKIRDSFYEWWNPTYGDIFEGNICGGTYVVDEQELSTQRSEAIHGNTTPLLTIGQLIEFIEWRTDCRVCIDYDSDDVFFELKYIGETLVETFEKFSHYDLLEGLWEVACSVATNARYDK